MCIKNYFASSSHWVTAHPLLLRMEDLSGETPEGILTFSFRRFLFDLIKADCCGVILSLRVFLEPLFIEFTASKTWFNANASFNFDFKGPHPLRTAQDRSGPVSPVVSLLQQNLFITCSRWDHAETCCARATAALSCSLMVRGVCASAIHHLPFN